MQKSIIIYSGIGALRHIREGYAKVFKHLGWNVFVHDVENPQFSPIDLFHKIKPNAWFGGSYEIDRATLKALQMYPNCELVVWAPNHGSMNEQIVKEGHQVLCVTENELKTLTSLKDSHNLKYVFTYYHQNWVSRTHNHYLSLDLEPIGLHLAADLFDYGVGTYNEKLASDIAFVGGSWSYKGINLRKYLYPLCSTDLSVKIFGGGSHPVPQHLGVISTSYMKDLFRSAKVCPAIYEPLASLGFDVSERIYKVLSSGGFCVSQYVESAINDIFINEEVVFAEKDNPADFIDKCVYFCQNPEKRLPYLERSLQYVKTDGTYFHRMEKLCGLMGWFNEAIQLQQILNNINICK